MSLSDAKDLATILGVVIALVTLIKGLIEYTHQGAQKRAERFFAFEDAFHSDEVLIEVCTLLEDDDDRLAELPYKTKLHFLGFYEQVALMVNSKLLRPGVAHYMFGYYAIRCWKSDKFWVNLNRESVYWSLFAAFAKEMMDAEKRFRLDPHALRF
jgi:hypothetical protein